MAIPPRMPMRPGIPGPGMPGMPSPGMPSPQVQGPIPSGIPQGAQGIPGQMPNPMANQDPMRHRIPGRGRRGGPHGPHAHAQGGMPDDDDDDGDDAMTKESKDKTDAPEEDLELTPEEKKEAEKLQKEREAGANIPGVPLTHGPELDADFNANKTGGPEPGQPVLVERKLPESEPTVEYVSFPIMNYSVGPYHFEEGRLRLPESKVKRFEKLIASCPLEVRRRVVKIDRDAADKLAAQHKEHQGSKKVSGMDSTANSFGPKPHQEA